MADSTRKRLRVVLEQIEARGGRNITYEINRHIKFRFQTSMGEPRTMIVSVSPSDWRADLDVKRKIRHLLRPASAG